jgi:hypothetical protein
VEKVISGWTILLPIDDEPVEVVPRAGRLATFKDKVIGFLSNGKDNVAELLTDIQTHLQAAFAPRAFIHRTKAHFAIPAALEQLQELHRECDAVIVAAAT